ncbi:MAG: GDSL-type esterase/lipase family protein, partial [Marmoricola sp.]
MAVAGLMTVGGLSFGGLVEPSTAAGQTTVQIPQSNEGTDFWLTFEGNYFTTSKLYLFIASNVQTHGTVTASGIGFTAPFNVSPGVVTQVLLPSNAQDASSDVVGHSAIHVVSADPVAAYGLNTADASTDGFTGLPTNSLAKSYIVQAYTNNVGTGSQFAVVATADATTVTITPSETIGTRSANVPFAVHLSQGETFQLNDRAVSLGDLSGTLVSSDKPVAVFAGSNCANVPTGYPYCNTLTEEMTPTSSWGTAFLTQPLAARSADTFRVMAATDGTKVLVNGAVLATLNAGKFREFELSAGATISASAPIQLMQYSEGQTKDGVSSDPFEITVPPTDQFLSRYTLATPPPDADPTIVANYINVVAPTSEVGSVTLDGSPIASSKFTQIPSSAYSGAQLPVAFGSHVLDGPLPFGTTIYGYGNYDGYGYPGGFRLTVKGLSMTPTSASGVPGASQQFVARDADQSNVPLPNVKVSFAVTSGPNAGVRGSCTPASCATNANGQVGWTYKSGAGVGFDVVTSFLDKNGNGVPDGNEEQTVAGVNWDSANGSYVALGDSFSSGEGNPPFSTSSPAPNTGYNSDTDGCHRSSVAYPHVAWTNSLAVPTSAQYWACSGATTDALFNPFKGEPAQISHVTKETTLITLTMGGNDAYFPDVLGECVINPCRGDWDARVCAMFMELGILSASTPGTFLYDYSKIKSVAAPNARILVLGYPRFFPKGGGGFGLGCNLVLKGDQRWINQKVHDMDVAIQNAANAAGIEYVDTENAFDGYELCNGKGNPSAMNGLMTPKVYNFHPDQLGQKLLGNAVIGELSEPDAA